MWNPEPNSILGWAPCAAGCGGRALAVRERASGALCGPCTAQKVGRVPDTTSTTPTPVRAFGVPIGWGAPLPPVPAEPHPEPLVTSRAEWPTDVLAPPSVKKLVALLNAEGFTTRLTYARGYVRSVKVGVFNEVESIGVRFQGYGRIGYAIYQTRVDRKAWVWDSIGVTRPGDFPFQRANRTDLTEWIKAHGSLPPSWFKGVIARIEDQKERQKESAKQRGSKPRESGG